MNQFCASVILVTSFLLSSMPVMAAPAAEHMESAVEHMSDVEVSEYAIRMSNALENIQKNQLCQPNDDSCVRSELARHGVSYDDKEAVKKRLAIMVGSIY